MLWKAPLFLALPKCMELTGTRYDPASAGSGESAILGDPMAHVYACVVELWTPCCKSPTLTWGVVGPTPIGPSTHWPFWNMLDASPSWNSTVQIINTQMFGNFSLTNPNLECPVFPCLPKPSSSCPHPVLRAAVRLRSRQACTVPCSNGEPHLLQTSLDLRHVGVT